MSSSIDDIDYDIKVGDLVIIREDAEVLLSLAYSNKICIVLKKFPENTNVIFNFELRIMTPEGKQVDVWLHEVKKIRISDV